MSSLQWVPAIGLGCETAACGVIDPDGLTATLFENFDLPIPNSGPACPTVTLWIGPRSSFQASFAVSVATMDEASARLTQVIAGRFCAVVFNHWPFRRGARKMGVTTGHAFQSSESFRILGRWALDRLGRTRARIEARQLRNLRRLFATTRRKSPLFRRLYADLPQTAEIALHDLPVTRKPELMAEFDDWLTIRSLPLARARDHLRDISKIGEPIDNVAVFQTSGSSGEPAVIVMSESFVE